MDCRVGMEMSGEGLRERETMKQGMTDLWATEWPRRLREEETTVPLHRENKST